MVWNTIAHLKMMNPRNEGASPTPGPTPFDGSEFTPVKFADPHKLSFYDIIVALSGSVGQAIITLVKGDFETLKRMIENNEAVCGGMFISMFDTHVMRQTREDIVGVEYVVDENIIALLFSDETKTLYLHSDNTITDSLTSGSSLPDGTAIDDGSGQSEAMVGP